MYDYTYEFTYVNNIDLEPQIKTITDFTDSLEDETDYKETLIVPALRLQEYIKEVIHKYPVIPEPEQIEAFIEIEALQDDYLDYSYAGIYAGSYKYWETHYIGQDILLEVLNIEETTTRLIITIGITII